MLLLPRHKERVVSFIIIVIVIINVNVNVTINVIVIIISLVAQAQGASCQLQGAGNEKSGRRQVSLNNWGQDLISQKIVIRIVIVIVKDYYHNYNGVKI